MSLENLPVEWKTTDIGQLVDDMFGGLSPKTTDYQVSGVLALNKGDIKQSGTLKIKNSANYLSDNFIGSNTDKIVQKNDVLVTLRDLSQKADFLGLVALYKGSQKAVITQGMYKLLLNNALDRRYLMWYSNSPLYRLQVKNEKVGATQVHLRNDQFKDLNIPLPPIAEQQEIVRQLDVMLAQVEQIKTRLDAIPAILKKFRQSVLADAVSGRLTEEWRGCDDYTIDESGLEIPNTWELKQIQDIADVKGGKRLPKGEELVSENTGYPYIRAGQLKNGTIIATEEARSTQMYLRPETQKLIKNYVIHKYDAYITIVGASIGDAGITPEKYDGANLTENAAKLTNYKKPLISQFLGFWLRSYYLQQLIKLETKSAAQGKLALTRIKTLPFLYPSIEEQKIIVEKVNDFLILAEGIEQPVQSAQKRVNLLTQSILAKAFSGELTAEWREQHQELITGINSAESLLAKIQAEREASKPVKKTRAKKES